MHILSVQYISIEEIR